MEFFLELLVDRFFDVVMESTSWCYLKLIDRIFPDKTIPAGIRDRIERITGIIGMVLFFTLIIGLIMLFPGGTVIRTVGMYTVVISLLLLLLPIAVGLILLGIRCFVSKKKT